MDQIAMFYVKEVACLYKPTDNYLPLSSSSEFYKKNGLLVVNHPQGIILI